MEKFSKAVENLKNIAVENLKNIASEIGIDVDVVIKNKPKEEEYILRIDNDGYIYINKEDVGYIGYDGILWLYKTYIQGDLYKKWKDGGCKVDETEITFKGYEFYIDYYGVLRMVGFLGNRIFNFKNLVP